MTRWTILVVMQVAIACGDPASPPPSPLLVGSWRYVPYEFELPLPLEQRAQLIFASDGSLRELSPDGDLDMSYSATDRTIVQTAGSLSVTFDYHATPDHLYLQAGFPVEPTDGTVGQWQLTTALGDDAQTIEYALRADKTSRIDRDDGTSFDGTWSHDGDELVVSYVHSPGLTIDEHFRELPGTVIANYLYERVP